MAGFCDRIEITINADGSVTVTDNGRGIPVDKHARTGKSALETVMTYLHAGGKFDSQAYKVSGGLHGVGAAVVNALSSQMWVEVHRGGKVHKQEYARGKAVGNLKVSAATASQARPAPPPGSCPTPRSSKKPSSTSTPWPSASARWRSSRRASGSPSRDERHDHAVTYYFEGGIKSFVRRLNTRPRHRARALLHGAQRRWHGRRGRDPVQRQLQRVGVCRSPTASTRSTAARTSPASARR